MFAPLFVYSYLTASVAAPRRNERGASFTEYVVLLGVVVAMVITVGFTDLGDKLAAAITAIDLGPTPADPPA